MILLVARHVTIASAFDASGSRCSRGLCLKKPGSDLDFSFSVGIRTSLPFSGSSFFNASIEHECIDQNLTAIPYDIMQHEAGCQPEAATANAASTARSSNEAAPPARQASPLAQVHKIAAMNTAQQERMTIKYLALRAWKAYWAFSLNEELDRPFKLYKDTVTTPTVLFPERWKSFREGKK